MISPAKSERDLSVGQFTLVAERQLPANYLTVRVIANDESVNPRIEAVAEPPVSHFSRGKLYGTA